MISDRMKEWRERKMISDRRQEWRDMEERMQARETWCNEARKCEMKEAGKQARMKGTRKLRRKIWSWLSHSSILFHFTSVCWRFNFYIYLCWNYLFIELPFKSLLSFYLSIPSKVHSSCPSLLIYLLYSFLWTTVLYHSVLFLFFQYFPQCHFIPSYLHLSSNFFLLCSSSVLPFYFDLFLLSIFIPFVFFFSFSSHQDLLLISMANMSYLVE